jgi:hypothetical protein
VSTELFKSIHTIEATIKLNFDDLRIRSSVSFCLDRFLVRLYGFVYLAPEHALYLSQKVTTMYCHAYFLRGKILKWQLASAGHTDGTRAKKYLWIFRKFGSSSLQHYL